SLEPRRRHVRLQTRRVLQARCGGGRRGAQSTASQVLKPSNSKLIPDCVPCFRGPTSSGLITPIREGPRKYATRTFTELMTELVQHMQATFRDLIAANKRNSLLLVI